jgi:hypothetical protein
MTAPDTIDSKTLSKVGTKFSTPGVAVGSPVIGSPALVSMRRGNMRKRRVSRRVMKATWARQCGEASL